MIETQDGSFFVRGPTPPIQHTQRKHRLVSELKFISLVPLTLSHIHFNSMCHSTNGHTAARQKSVVRKPQSVSV
jgi:hypothetical protein